MLDAYMYKCMLGCLKQIFPFFVRIGSFSTLNIWGPGHSSDDDNLCEIESSNNSFDELVLLCKGRYPSHLLRTAVEVI